MSELTLLERLRETELLSKKQLAELAELPEANDPDPRVLGKVIFKRGWLTRYQVSHVAAGKARDLRVGPYLLIDRLGEGGMGTVYRAKHLHLGRQVALKIIRKDKLANPTAIHRFYQEVQAAGQLTHPNIVLAFDAQEANGRHFFAMELVEGPDLSHLVKEKGPLPVWQACEYVRQAALGLQHAHDAGLVHRDIKPSNLLVATPTRQASGPGTVKVLDMGLALLDEAAYAGQRNMTRAGQVLGTPDYLAPEQAVDAHRVDGRADVYSLGCTLYYLLTGRPPYDAGSMAETLLRHQNDELPQVRRVRKDVPEELEAVLRRMVAKKPADRIPSAAAVAEALAPFASQQAASTPVLSADTGGFTSPPVTPSAETWADLGGSEELVSKPARTNREPSRTQSGDRPRTGLLVAGSVLAGVVLLGGIALGVILSRPGPPAPDKIAGKDKDREQEKDPPVPIPKPIDVKPVAATPPAGSVEADGAHFVLRGDGKPVVSLALSPDGKLAAAGGQDGAIYVWNLEARKEVFRQAKTGGPVESLCLPAGGKRVQAVVGSIVHQWDLESGKSVEPTDRAASLLLPDGQTVIHLTQTPTATVAVFLDLERGAELARTPAADSTLRDACVFAGGRQLLLLGANDAIQLLDLSVRRQIVGMNTAPRATNRPRSVCGGRIFGELLWGGSEGGLWVTDPRGGAALNGSTLPMTRQVSRPHTGDVTALALSSAGAFVLSGGADHAVALTDLYGNRVLSRFAGHTAAVSRASFVPGGKLAVTASLDGTLRLWNLARPTTRVPAATEPTMTEEVKRFTSLGGPVVGVRLDPTGKELLTAAFASIRRFEVNGALVASPTQAEASILAMAVSPDGRRTLTGGCDAVARIYESATGKLLRELVTESQVRAVAFSPDGRHVLTAGGGTLFRKGGPGPAEGKPPMGDYDVRLWEVDSGLQVSRYAGPQSPVLAVAFTGDGSHVVASAVGSTLFVWQRESKQRLAGAAGGDVAGFGWTLHPVGGTQVLEGTLNGAVTLRDAVTSREVRRFPGHAGIVTGLALAADGVRVVSTSTRSLAAREGLLLIHELASGKLLARLPLPFRPVSLSCGGKLAALGESDGAARLLDLEKIKLDTPPPPPPPPQPPAVKPYEGHAGAVTAVQFSPDSGKLLASGGSDGTVRIWQVGSGKLLVTIRLAGPVKALRFSRDGSLVMAVAEGAIAGVWEATTGKIHAYLPSGTAAASPTCVDGFSNKVIHAVGFESELRVTRKRPTVPDGDYKRVTATAPVTAVVAIGDQAFVWGDQKGQLTLWSAVTEKPIATQSQHKDAVTCLAYDVKSSRLYSGGPDRRVLVYTATAKTLTPLGSLLFTTLESAVTGLSLTPDGSRLAVCGKDRTVRIYSTRPKGTITTLKEDATPLGVAISPDGKTVAIATEKGLRVREVKKTP